MPRMSNAVRSVAAGERVFAKMNKIADELFEVFIVGAFGTCSEADYHRFAMNPATKEAWKQGLLAVRKHVLKTNSTKSAT